MTVDHQRRHFESTYLHFDPNDVTRHELPFNTDRNSVEESARLIADLVSSPNFREKRAMELAQLRPQMLGYDLFPAIALARLRQT